MKLKKFLLISIIYAYFPPTNSNSDLFVEYGPSFASLSKIGSRSVIQACDPQVEEYCPSAPPLPPKKIGSWASGAVKKHHDILFRGVFKMVMDKGLFYNEKSIRNRSPFNFKTPEEIYKIFDFELKDEAETEEKLLELTEKIIDYSPHLSHPLYLTRRAAGLDPYGILGDWVTGIMNNCFLTYLFAPVFILAEIEMFSFMRKLIGYNGGDGIGTPFPHGFAMRSALHRKYPDIKLKGFQGSGLPRPVIFISEQADYSGEKQAAFQGFGDTGVKRVKSHHDTGKMNITSLEEEINISIKKGYHPLMIVAEAGTPVLGAFDSIVDCANIAKKYNLWLHVDGTIGGALLFSDDKKEKYLKGIERSDSMSFSPNSLLGNPFQLTMVITKHENLFKTVFDIGNVTHVFSTTTLTDRKLDLGENSIQTARRANTFKLWFMIKSKGKKGLGDHIDYIYNNTKFAIEELRRRNESFHMALEDFESPILTFYYIHPTLRHLPRNSIEFNTKTQELMQKLKAQLLNDGLMQLSYTKYSHQESSDLLTIKLSNSALVENDIVRIFDQIETCGDEVFYLGKRGKCTKIEYSDPPESFPEFVNAPIRSMHGDLFGKFIDMVLNKALYFQNKRLDGALKFKKPEVLKILLNVTLDDYGLNYDQEKILNTLEAVIDYSGHQAHPYYMYQLYSGLDPLTVIAEILMTVMSSPQITYDDNPIFMLMEKELSKYYGARLGPRWSGSITGYPPGGSVANIFSVRLARDIKAPHIKYEGYSKGAKLLRGYTSQAAHYSFKKGALYIGIGSENMVVIEADVNSRMNITKLRQAIESDIKAGHQPFYVGATCGTTVSGAVDDLNAIADICQQYGLYFHIDGTLGGSLIMSNNRTKLNKLKGVERADSFTINPTKMLSSTQLMTLFVARVSKIAMQLVEYIDGENRTKSYGHMEESYFVRPRVFKMWLSWKAKGIDGYTKHLDYIFDIVDFTMGEMKKREGFETLIPTFEMTNILFLYVPERIRNMDRKSMEFYNQMEQISFSLQGKLVLNGLFIVVAQRQHEYSPLHLKLVLMNSGITKDDIIYLLDQVEYIGRKL